MLLTIMMTSLTSQTPSLCSLYLFTGLTLKADWAAFRPDMILVVWYRSLSVRPLPENTLSLALVLLIFFSPAAIPTMVDGVRLPVVAEHSPCPPSLSGCPVCIRRKS